MTITTISIILLIVILIAFRLWKKKKGKDKYKKSFDLIFNEIVPKPIYEYGFTDGFPTFTITYATKAKLIKAKEMGTPKLFTLEIEKLCKDIGSESNPFDAELAVWFTYEGELEQINAKGPSN